jgi:hypothetical protein
MENQILPIHFGNLQGKHAINSVSLLVFIEAYKEISEIFGASIDVQIGTPEEGGWKANLFIAITFIGLNPLVALLTGETADDWAKKGHVEIVKLVNNFITTKAAALPEEFPKELINQKNNIFDQFQKDICIDSFRLGDLPLIPRQNFHEYISLIPDELAEYLGETNITVSSPDWKGKRSWRGKIEIIDEPQSSFSFDKDLTGKFWEKVKLDSLLLHTTDVMRVQLIKRPSSKVKYQVIRVLNYNGEDVDQALSNVEINGFAIFSPQNPIIEPILQLTLPFTDSQV